MEGLHHPSEERQPLCSPNPADGAPQTTAERTFPGAFLQQILLIRPLQNSLNEVRRARLRNSMTSATRGHKNALWKRERVKPKLDKDGSLGRRQRGGPRTGKQGGHLLWDYSSICG